MLMERKDVEEMFNKLVLFYGISDECDMAELDLISKNPYHNEYHIMSVVCLCAIGASESGMAFDATRDLLIAALFHDFGHAGGHQMSDADNIRTATDRIRTLSLEGFFAPAQAKKLIRFIRATEFPFADEPPVPYPMEIQILRDADIMQSLLPDWDKMYYGLQLEASINQKRVVSDKAWWDMANGFYETAKFFTQWGRNTVSGVRDDENLSPLYHAGWRDAAVEWYAD